MKKVFSIFILILTILFLSLPLQADETLLDKQEINIFEAISMAVSSNPDLMISEAQTEGAEAKLGQAKSAFLPRVTLENEYLRTDAPQWIFSKTIDARELSFQSDFNNPEILDNVESGVSLKYNLYRGGRDKQNLRQSKLFYKIRKLGYDETLNYVVLSVIVAYYDVLAAGERVQVARKSVKTVESQIDRTTKLYENGAALKSDLLSLKVRLAETKELLLTSENSYKLAMVALKTVMGKSSDREFALSNNEWRPLSIPETVQEALPMAEENRGMILSARENVLIAQAEIKKAWGGYLPEANIWGRYYFDENNFDYSMNDKNWFLSLRIDWNLFDGFMTKNRINEAKARLLQAEANLKKATLHVEKDVRSAYLNLSASKYRQEVTQASVAAAEESLRLVKLSYEGGSANITRYLDAELDLTTARSLNIKSNYDFKKAVANCFYSLGYCGICAQMKTGENNEK